MRRALWVAALCGAACTPDFATQSQVTDLRVLAVRAEPPEALVDLQAQTVQDVTVRALVVDPARTGLLQTGVRLCFPTDTRRCDARSIDLGRQSTQLGAEVRYQLSVPAALIAGALQDDRLKGLGGIRVQLELDAADGDPAGVVTAAKTLVYSKAQPGYVPNHTPIIAALALTRAGAPVSTLHDGETLQLTAGAPLGMRPVLADGAIEEYDTTDLQGRALHLREQLSYAFFTTAGGEVDRESADEPLERTTAPPDGLSRLRAGARGQGTLWIVVRDGRGGESWFTAPWIAR